VSAHAVRARYGPSAFGDDLRRFVALTTTLAATEFKLRYFGSALGYLWSLARPLLLFGVLYTVFTHIVRFGHAVPHYPVYLLASIMLWTFFAETTSGAVTCLVDRENLVRKIRFPRMVIPLSVVLTALFNLAVNFVAVLVFVLASGIRPGVRWLELPLLVGLLAVLAAGVAMLLSALYVRFRDVSPIWEVSLQVLFYGSPIIYVATTYPHSVQRLLSLSPIATVMSQTRHALIDPAAPSAAALAGGWAWLAVPVAIAVAVFALGLWVFNRETPRIAENL
jgi:ABC-2 type transport system permease protein